MPQLVWLVTATTSGLGAELVRELVARGEKVIATGRKATERLSHLKSDNVAIIDLDVSAPRAEIEAQVKEAWDVWGRVDVLMNNAGMAAFKNIEEADDAFLQNIFNVNLFGNLRVTQSILPYFRAQKSGTIAFTGAGLSWAPMPFFTPYSASKAALNIFVEGLAKEVKQFNIDCIIFEPGGFESKLGAPREESSEGPEPAIAEYKPLFYEVMGAFVNEIVPGKPGDVQKISTRIVDGVKGEGLFAGRPKPIRVILGSDSLGAVQQKVQEQGKLAEEWKDVSLSTDLDGHDHQPSQAMLAYMSILK
ncbi:hypothetical protein CMUS01_06639 [Colletotrichum musicola]|uniref:Short chain dehydrogenase n=1 Tax=Colletotrichum musicola TaxID=2175873 RepID=A0A8H6KL16_9PEZI|nr:hypothetical protein CMUS01_06639 [Colletotrichum musicola]